MAPLDPALRRRIFDRIDERLDATVELLSQYVAIPSVSVGGDAAAMTAAAEFLAEQYRGLGCQEVEVVETETYPGVWAYYDAGAPVTILNYDMYDVRQPGDPGAWTYGPFEPKVEPRQDVPAVLYGRGAHVPKGPDIAWLAGLSAYREVAGELPVNIAFLAEGDEILGSVSYAGLLERYRDRISRADGVVYLRATQDDAGVVPVRLGYKAFLTFELHVTGERWGRGPTGAAHAALRTIVDSPALRLAQAITTLYGPDGELAVAPWQPHLAPVEIPDEDRPLIDGLLAHYGDAPWGDVIPALGAAGVSRYAHGATGLDVLVRYIYGSALNIQGYHSGYTGPGTRTFTIPERASARFDARLTTTASPEVLLDGLREHLDGAGFDDVEIEILSAYPASRAALDTPLMSSFLDTIERHGGTPLLWPAQAYGGPWSLLAHDFGLPVVFGAGIGHGGGVGLPDEHVVVDGGFRRNGLPEMSRFVVDLLATYAERATAGGDAP